MWLPSWGLETKDLVKRDGLYYAKFTDVPFTGEIDEGLRQGKFKNGKKTGIWSHYDYDGLLRDQGEYRDGCEEGIWVGYHKNGQLAYRAEYKCGLLDGLYVSYWEDGSVHMKGEHKDNKNDGVWVVYDRNGRVVNAALKTKA